MEDCEALELPIQDVLKIRKEFPSVASLLYDTSEEACADLLQKRLRVQDILNQQPNQSQVDNTERVQQIDDNFSE